MRAYVELVKPGIVLGNLVSLLGAFLLASRGRVDWMLLCAVAVAISLVVASGCAVNNVYDRDIDARMKRTRRRPTVSGAVSPAAALLLAALLGLTGMALLYQATRRVLPLALLLIGYAVYTWLYTMVLKRRSIHGTLIGSISGAMPPVVAYCAVSGRMDAAAWTLFAMYALWQIPHSYAIAVMRADDYRAAEIPVLPAIRGLRTTRRHMAAYIVTFTVAAAMLSVLGFAGWVYLACAIACGSCWLWTVLKGFAENESVRWARKIFLCSITVVCLLSVAMALPN